MMKSPFPPWLARLRAAMRPKPKPVEPHVHYCLVRDHHWLCYDVKCVKHLVTGCGVAHKWRNAPPPKSPPIEKSWLHTKPGA